MNGRNDAVLQDEKDCIDRNMEFVQCDVCLRHFPETGIIINKHLHSIVMVCEKCSVGLDEKFDSIRKEMEEEE